MKGHASSQAFLITVLFRLFIAWKYFLGEKCGSRLLVFTEILTT